MKDFRLRAPGIAESAAFSASPSGWEFSRRGQSRGHGDGGAIFYKARGKGSTSRLYFCFHCCPRGRCTGDAGASIVGALFYRCIA